MAIEQESMFADNFSSLDAGSNATDAVSLTGENEVASNMDDETKEATDGGAVTAARENTETTGRDIPTQNDQLTRRMQNEGTMKREVLVHALFTKPGPASATN